MRVERGAEPQNGDGGGRWGADPKMALKEERGADPKMALKGEDGEQTPKR